MQDNQCRTIIASDEGIPISVLELALHIFLQAANCSVGRAGLYTLCVILIATHLCLFHSNVHIPVQASKDSCKGMAMKPSELIVI